jgi:hypothetical protein
MKCEVINKNKTKISLMLQLYKSTNNRIWPNYIGTENKIDGI